MGRRTGLKRDEKRQEEKGSMEKVEQNEMRV